MIITWGLGLLVGLQFVFWGLNGFANWIPVPPSHSQSFDEFVNACYKVRGLMLFVKLAEIFGGALLCYPGTQLLGILILFPIVFGITLLQVFHHPRPWPVLGLISLPFLALLMTRLNDFSILI